MAKKKEEVLSRAELAAQTAAMINQKLKNPNAVQVGEQFMNTFLIRRPTGITSLDLHCAGGFPAGLTQVIGKASAGKNGLANCVIRECQTNYGAEASIFACMIESVYDKYYAKRQGVRIAYTDDEILMVKQAYADMGFPEMTPEQEAWFRDGIGTFHHMIDGSAEEKLDAVVMAVASNAYQIVLLDSLGVLNPEGEEEKDLSDARKVGAEAALVTRFMKKLHSAMNSRDKYNRPNTTTIIAINQHRENIQNPYDLQEGANSLKHGKLLDILLSSGSKILKDDTAKEDPYKNPVIGKNTYWRIIKGKAGCHDGPSGSYNFYFGEQGFDFGPDVVGDLILTATFHGVMERNGAWYSYNGESVGCGIIQASKTIKERGLFQQIRKEVFKHAGVSFLIKEPF